MPTATQNQQQREQLSLLSLRVSWTSSTGGPHCMPAGSGLFSLPDSLWPHVLGPLPQLGGDQTTRAVPMEHEALGALAFASASWELNVVLPTPVPDDALSIILKPRGSTSPVINPEMTLASSADESGKAKGAIPPASDNSPVSLKFKVTSAEAQDQGTVAEPTFLELKLWVQWTEVSPFSLAACWKAQHGLVFGPTSRHDAADICFESHFSEEGEPREDDIDAELQKYEIPAPDKKTPVYQADAAEEPRSAALRRPGSERSSTHNSPSQGVSSHSGVSPLSAGDSFPNNEVSARRSTSRQSHDSPVSSTGTGSQKSPGMGYTISIKDLVVLGDEPADELELEPPEAGSETAMPSIPDITSPPGRTFDEMGTFAPSPQSIGKEVEPPVQPRVPRIPMPVKSIPAALYPDEELSVRDGVFGKSRATEDLLATHAMPPLEEGGREAPAEGPPGAMEDDDWSEPAGSHGSFPAAEGAGAAAAAAERLLSKERRRLAIVMVGLPARGKTFTATKLTRYLRWLGHDTKLFNVGKYRRVKLGPGQTSDFFSSENKEGVDARNEVAAEAFEDMLSWMDQGGQVGVFDATNSTRERRQMLQSLADGRCKLIFLECLCNDESIVDRNAREKIRASPDYATRGNPKEALEDFIKRLRNYERSYEPVMEGSYIKLINMVSGDSGQMQINNISGYLPGRIVFFLLNTHITPRPVILTRHGESLYNVAGRIGGDAALSGKGEEYAVKLADFINKRFKHEKMASVWTSTLQRTILTSRHIAPFPKVQWRALDEIQAGICDGMTYQEIKEQMPDEYKARKLDKLRYRYPRGESYLDVIQRLEPGIVELERQRHPVVVIAHQAVLRALYAYFMDKPLKEVPHIEMPLHTVIELTTGVSGINEKRYKLMDAPSSP